MRQPFGLVLLTLWVSSPDYKIKKKLIIKPGFEEG
jgi:hypothetical protein